MALPSCLHLGQEWQPMTEDVDGRREIVVTGSWTIGDSGVGVFTGCRNNDGISTNTNLSPKGLPTLRLTPSNKLAVTFKDISRPRIGSIIIRIND